MNKLLFALHECVASGVFDVNLLDNLTSDVGFIQECEVLDFKESIPKSDAEYAKTLRDLVAFHNSYGGFLVFGVKEVEKDRVFEISGLDGKVDVAKLRDNAKNYFDSEIRICCQGYNVRERYVDVLWVDKRAQGRNPVKFKKNGPEEKPGKLAFKKGEIVFREIGNNAIAQKPSDYEFLYSERSGYIDDVGGGFYVGRIIDNNLPDRSVVCSKFVGRNSALLDLWRWMADPHSRVRLIAGEGGLGKTSLAYYFAEKIVSTGGRNFYQVVWLTAKSNRFSVDTNSVEKNYATDFCDAKSLFSVIGESHGCTDEDYGDGSIEDIRQAALSACSSIPSFIVIDDIDSLSQEDQRRVLQFGLQVSKRTKLLVTTRVNLSYSSDNVLMLNGLDGDEYSDYVMMLRSRYGLPVIENKKIERVRRVSGGSPLFTDSLFRLEARGFGLDSAINKWEKDNGMDVRRFALEREISQLTREAKRVIYVISRLKNVSLVEIKHILKYSEQTLGDAIDQLKGVFLVAAPPIGKEIRFTTDDNTARLVLEMAPRIVVDRSLIEGEIKRARSDAIGASINRRDGIVGLAINQANASYKNGDSVGALKVVVEASKKLNRPHMDLLLAVGRFCLLIPQPDREMASTSFKEAYDLGQRKPLLFNLWFESEVGRGMLYGALDVAGFAIECNGANIGTWYEHRASVHIALAKRPGVEFSRDSAIREYKMAVKDLMEAKKYLSGSARHHKINRLVNDIRESINNLEVSA
jgi:putative transcriptional regulator